MRISYWSADVCSSDLDALLAGAAQLQTAIADRVDANQCATLARDLAGQLLAVYPVALSPKQPPNLARGQQLYAEQCAGCHGADGHGDGPLARQLEPKPVAFSDVTRARERSLFALYQVVTQGLDRSEEHTSEIQSLMRISYAVCGLK